MQGSMRTAIVMLALLGTPASAQPSSDAQPCPTPLPGPVAAKREAILAAAQAKDHLRLSALADRQDFAFNFSAKHFRVNHWRGGGANDPDSAAAVRQVLQMSCALEIDAKGRRIFHWPSAALVARAKLTAAERDELARFHGERLEAQWNDGKYEGWRARIDADGRWLAFINGF